MAYNATAYKLDENGKVFSVEAVEVDADGSVIRACGLWSHENGTKQYEQTWRNAQFSMVKRIHIERDGAEGYRNRLRRLALPPSYV